VGHDVELSVVAPAHNEAENLPVFVAEVASAMAAIGRSWELIVVDDASTDDGVALLRDLMGRHQQLRVVLLSRRTGQTGALTAGLAVTRGRFIAMLDADCQNEPRDVGLMLEKLEEEALDMVNGWRKTRQDNWLRLVSTRVANWVRNRLTHEHIQDSASGIKVFRAACLERIRLYDGMHRFLPTLFRLEGFRVAEMPVSHRPRSAGRAKYGVWNRVFRALGDALAVRWMRSRLLRYEARELERNDA